jgi:hypothetical protein
MHRLRGASPLSFLLLVVLWYCTQTCVLIAGRQPAAVAAATATEHSPERAPCHSSSSPLPHETTDHCGNCGHHLYLKTDGAEAGAVAAWQVSFVSFFGSSISELRESRHSREAVSIERTLASAPPCYLAFSVLRL